MDRLASLRLRVGLAIAVAVAVGALLSWQHLHDGVPAHSFLARKDMPSFSNWWGLLTLPALTWFAVGNIQSRLADHRVSTRSAAFGFFGALLFGLVLAVAFELGFNAIPSAQIQLVPLIALLLPIYRAESLLGFILALSYTFGGVLPLIIGTVLATGGAALYLVPRWALRRFRMKR